MLKIPTPNQAIKAFRKGKVLFTWYWENNEHSGYSYHLEGFRSSKTTYNEQTWDIKTPKWVNKLYEVFPIKETKTCYMSKIGNYWHLKTVTCTLCMDKK